MAKDQLKLVSKNQTYRYKRGKSIFIKILVAFILLSITPVLFSSFLTISTFQEVLHKYIDQADNQQAINLSGEVDQDLFLTQQNVRAQLGLIVFLTVILALFISILISRSLTQPVRKLVQGTKAIAAGNLNFRLQIESPAEFGALAYSFNQMAQDLKTSRTNLEVERDKTKSIITYLTDGLIVIDKQSRLVLINPEAGKMLGLQEKDFIGKKIENGMMESENIFHKNLARVTFGEIKQGAKTKEAHQLTQVYEVNLYDPAELILKVTRTPIYDAAGKISGSMRILHDITRDKTIDRMKSEFISIAAHQLRTPLSSIKWVIRMALDGDAGKLNAEQADLLNKGYLSNERVIKLVNDLLNVSRIEEGRFGFNFSKVNFKEVIEVVIGNLEKQIKQSHLKFNLEMPKKLPELNIDKERIILAMQNLMDNAVKYTPEYGKVNLKINIIKPGVEVVIEDNGVGIPRKDQNRLFSKFFRATNVMRMQTDGTGLGLFIARNIIEKHDGKIKIASQEGKGTKVTLMLPLNRK